MARDELFAGGRRRARRGDARGSSRRRAGRGPGPRRHLRAIPRTAAGIRPGARHRHADLGVDDHGRRRRHGAGRPAPGRRDARRRLRAVRHRRARQPGGEEPLHVRRPEPGAAGRADADRPVGRRRRRSTRSRSRRGSRTSRASPSSRRRRRPTTTACWGARSPRATPSSTSSTRSCGDRKATSSRARGCRWARRACCAAATTSRWSAGRRPWRPAPTRLPSSRAPASRPR